MNMGITTFRCVTSCFHFIIITIFFLFTLASSNLIPAQTNTMHDLFKLLHNQTTWNIQVDPCLWSGVKCTNNTNSSSSVTTLSLSNFGLTSSDFLPLACNIDSLEVLDVSKNKLSSIPDGFFTFCRGLKSVNFSRNRISGSLMSFSDNFPELESLDLSHNFMNGTIGFQLNGSVSLKSLNLSFNQFFGAVPVNFGKSMTLQQLQLSGNLFQGQIPEQLAKYKNLRVLDLSTNNLRGNLPPRFEQLRNLEVLVLSQNSLTGEVPNFISRIATLQRFAANQNKFTGAIPAGISRFLKNLDLSYNSLGGSIQDDLLSGSNLQSVDFTSNGLVGPIPANISSNMVRLRLGNNALNGSIWKVNWDKLQKLMYLELDKNSFSGSIPPNMGSCQNLRLLSLDGNHFSGELPAELVNLTRLQGLNLQQNQFVGDIPNEITMLPNLLTLNMSWNSLSGSIPPSISNLSKLQFLDLQGNNLSGIIPRNIGQMNDLIELQLGKNQLSGYIPSMPKYSLSTLNLSSNLFKEQIPNTLQITPLEILDLSNNKFYGEVPSFLTHMQSLTLLLLSNNNLSGTMPSFRPNVMLRYYGNILINTTANSPESGKKHVTTGKVVEVAGAAIFGITVAVVAVFLLRRKLHRVNIVTQEDFKDSPLSQATKSRLLSANGIHKSRIDFTKAMEAVADPLNLMFKTKYSNYYKVTMPCGVPYFVKKINLSDRICEPGSQESLGHELEALGKLNNSNIMTPLAYTLTADKAYLFYEMTFKGTLFAVLHRSTGIPLDWASRCSIAVGVAQGLASLHGCLSGPLLLFDLTSKTVMLKSLKEPQIGDIELSKVIDPSKSTSSLSAVAGSVGYIPPEYAYTMRVTTAGNVYSFGVILLELLTGKQAVSEGTELAKWALSNSSQPQKRDWMLDVGINRKSAAVKRQMLAVFKIALACINASSEARPKMKSVVRMLQNVR